MFPACSPGVHLSEDERNVTCLRFAHVQSSTKENCVNTISRRPRLMIGALALALFTASCGSEPRLANYDTGACRNRCAPAATDAVPAATDAVPAATDAGAKPVTLLPVKSS